MFKLEQFLTNLLCFSHNLQGLFFLASPSSQSEITCSNATADTNLAPGVRSMAFSQAKIKSSGSGGDWVEAPVVLWSIEGVWAVQTAPD